MFSKEIFIDRVKYLRDEHLMTQAMLAEKLGISKATVAQWERGARLPSIEVAIQLADYFNVSLDWLFGRSDDPKIHSPCNCQNTDSNC